MKNGVRPGSLAHLLGFKAVGSRAVGSRAARTDALPSQPLYESPEQKEERRAKNWARSQEILAEERQIRTLQERSAQRWKLFWMLLIGAFLWLDLWILYWLVRLLLSPFVWAYHLFFR